MPRTHLHSEAPRCSRRLPIPGTAGPGAPNLYFSKGPEVILMLCPSFGSHWKYGPNTAVFGIRKIWAPIPALPLISSVTWANNLTPSAPGSLPIKMGTTMPTSQGYKWEGDPTAREGPILTPITCCDHRFAGPGALSLGIPRGGVSGSVFYPSLLAQGLALIGAHYVHC